MRVAVCDAVTLQHSPVFQHADTAFGGRRPRLHCCSPELARVRLVESCCAKPGERPGGALGPCVSPGWCCRSWRSRSVSRSGAVQGQLGLEKGDGDAEGSAVSGPFGVGAR